MDVGFDFFGGFRTNALKCVIYWSRAGAVFARCCPLFFALINSSERFVGFYPINYVIIYSRQSTILKVGRKGEQMWARTLRYFAHYRRWAVAAGPTRNEWPKVIAKGDFCHIITTWKIRTKISLINCCGWISRWFSTSGHHFAQIGLINNTFAPI